MYRIYISTECVIITLTLHVYDLTSISEGLREASVCSCFYILLSVTPLDIFKEIASPLWQQKQVF